MEVSDVTVSVGPESGFSAQGPARWRPARRWAAFSAEARLGKRLLPSSPSFWSSPSLAAVKSGQRALQMEKHRAPPAPLCPEPGGGNRGLLRRHPPGGWERHRRRGQRRSQKLPKGRRTAFYRIKRKPDRCQVRHSTQRQVDEGRMAAGALKRKDTCAAGWGSGAVRLSGDMGQDSRPGSERKPPPPRTQPGGVGRARGVSSPGLRRAQGQSRKQ